MTGGLHDVIWSFYYLSGRGQDLHNLIIIALASFTLSYLEKQVIEMRKYLLMSSEECWEGRNRDKSCRVAVSLLYWFHFWLVSKVCRHGAFHSANKNSEVTLLLSHRRNQHAGEKKWFKTLIRVSISQISIESCLIQSPFHSSIVWNVVMEDKIFAHSNINFFL